jgi:hypothetical protein
VRHHAGIIRAAPAIKELCLFLHVFVDLQISVSVICTDTAMICNRYVFSPRAGTATCCLSAILTQAAALILWLQNATSPFFSSPHIYPRMQKHVARLVIEFLATVDIHRKLELLYDCGSAGTSMAVRSAFMFLCCLPALYQCSVDVAARVVIFQYCPWCQLFALTALAKVSTGRG